MPRRHGLLDRDVRQSSLIVVPGFICKSVVACWHNQHEGWLHQRVWRAQPPDLARLQLHVENGLLEIRVGLTPQKAYSE